MIAHPLTHHDILGLIAPFTRRGRHVDLAASHRLERRLVFKPVVHADPVDPSAALRETLQLENPEAGSFLLTRTMIHACALEASLQAEGPDPAELLARVESIHPQRQFRSGPGYVIAQSHRLEPSAAAPPDSAPTVRMLLARGVVQLDGLTLKLRVPAVSGISADIELVATAGATLSLPEDLLAVLGWDWARLERGREGWTSSLRLRGNTSDRSRDGERKLERMAQHLARTFAEPPGRFHERRIAARWGVALRRTLPLLTCLGLIAGAVAVPSLGLGQDSIFRMLIFHAPPLLLVVGICMREMPRIEIPPLPRASTAATWRETKA